MKYLFNTLACITACALNPAYAQVLHGEISKTNPKLEIHLNEGDVLMLKYDLSRGHINREHEWTTYAMFCSTLGKAEVTITNHADNETIKLPALMSNEEYGQEHIGTNIDKSGELTITNLSPFYSGTIVTCELHHKFGA